MILLFVISNDQKNYVMYCNMIVQDSTLVRMEYSLDENYSELIAFKERNIFQSHCFLSLIKGASQVM